MEKPSFFVKSAILFVGFILLIIYNGISHATDPLEQRAPLSSLQTVRAPADKIDILNIYPHDPKAFTQGLFFHGGFLYESTGLCGKSALFKKDVKNGKILKRSNLSQEYFGEGIAVLGTKIYQLTWQNETGFVYDLKSLKKIGQFSYQGEGWGLTTNGKTLIMSNGSPIITFRDPDSFSIQHHINVHDGPHFIEGLNELEFIKGEIWANIFTKNVVARISPETGQVLGWIDMKPLFDSLDPLHQIDVLNGIAYDEKSDRIFVTGKLWPSLFEIRISSGKGYPSGK